MNKAEKEKLIKFMLENRKQELEELEKSIVITTLKMEYLVSNENYDIGFYSMLKQRRDNLEMEYENVKRDISLLESGILPEEKASHNADKCLYNAKMRLQECLKIKNQKQIDTQQQEEHI